MNYHREEENHYPKAFAISSAIMGGFLLISFFIIASRASPEIGTGGIIVNVGTSVIGMNDDYMTIDDPSSSPNANGAIPDKVIPEDQELNEASSEVTDRSIVTQSSEDAPSVATKEKSTANTPTSNLANKENKPTVNQNALYKGPQNNSTARGDGTGNVAGNQGSEQGDALSPDYGEGGSGFGDEGLDMASRRFTSLSIPKDEGQKYGKVAVRIRVDRNGVVRDATPGWKGTTLVDNAIWEKCRVALMGARLNRLENAPEMQTGVVVFNFKVR